MLPGTNGEVEYRCTGAITQGGARCDRDPTNNESVLYRINGVQYPLHRGCAGPLNFCVDTRTPSTGSLRRDDGMGGAELLCEAMGYDPNATDRPATVPARTVREAVIVQTNPFVWGYQDRTGAVTDYVWCKR